MNLPAPRNPVVIFLWGALGVMTCVWLALIALKPQSPPDYMVRLGFVFIVLPTAIFAAVVISDWITYFRNR